MEDVKIRVIDSDKLIKAINDGSYEVNLSAVMALGAVVTQSASQWTPCSERLPKLNGYYLTTIKWGEDFYEVDIYEYDSYYKEWNEGEYFGGTVVAWMPLPTPYREGRQDEQ